MNTDDQDQSLGGEATFAGSSKPHSADVSLGDARTLGGNSEARINPVIGDIEVVDLEARYKPEGTLGQGGMGAVVLATDTRLGRKVAIKRILGDAAGNRMAVQRFLTEAKSIAALNHPNVVQIYDYGWAKDGPFLIMEYVDGGSLLDKCRDAALPLDLKQANAKRPFLPLWHDPRAQTFPFRRRECRLRGSGCRKSHVDLGCTSCGQG